jgi:AbrB family looped-hinge helix DNA binding protein
MAIVNYPALTGEVFRPDLIKEEVLDFMETTLDKFGRVVIPKNIRDHLGLKSGEVLQIERLEDEVMLKPLREESPLHNKEGVLVFSGAATGNMIEAIRVQREEQLRKNALPRKK